MGIFEFLQSSRAAGSASFLGACCWGAHLARAWAVLCLLVLAGRAGAADFVVVLSSPSSAHEAVGRVLERELESRFPPGGSKRVGSGAVETVTLSAPGDDEALQRALSSSPPAVAVAVGSRAYRAVSGASGVPLVFLLVPGVPENLARRPNSAGISMDVSPDDALRALKELTPRARRVGVVHDPERTGAFAVAARAAAARLGVALVERPVRGAAQVPEALRGLRGEVDALWLLPDPVFGVRENLDAAALFSVEQRVPVLTFAERHLDQGATVAVVADPAVLGRQAAALAAKLFAGTNAASVPLAFPERPVSKINSAVAGKLGLKPPRGTP